MIEIRELWLEDAGVISAEFTAQNWHKPTSQYEQYFRETEAGTRAVLVAELDGAIAGYTTIMWRSHYPPFADANTPEIVDFNVYIKYQRRGVGTALMDEAERRIAQRSPIAGIGVGLMHDYGNAQILYVKRGYIPDGRGIYHNGHWLNHGDSITISDNVALYFTKQLPTNQRA